jgi:hypothetical protein
VGTLLPAAVGQSRVPSPVRSGASGWVATEPTRGPEIPVQRHLTIVVTSDTWAHHSAGPRLLHGCRARGVQGRRRAGAALGLSPLLAETPSRSRKGGRCAPRAGAKGQLRVPALPPRMHAGSSLQNGRPSRRDLGPVPKSAPLLRRSGTGHPNPGRPPPHTLYGSSVSSPASRARRPTEDAGRGRAAAGQPF